MPRFVIEYLGQMREFSKNVMEPKVEIGKVVLVEDTVSKRISWPLARIIKTFPGRDEKIRLVQVRTKAATFLRPIQRLYPFEEQERSSLPEALPKPSARAREVELDDLF